MTSDTASTAAHGRDPTAKYPKPPFPEQHQPWPGLCSRMQPRPDHGERNYKGSGRLMGRRALITGGDSGMGRAAAIAFAIGAIGTMIAKGQRAFLSTAVMMVLFFQAARMALVVFDPYLSSRPLAEALMRAPEGKLIVDHHYYTFSSIFFYTNRDALLLNGRFNNLVYGSYAPGAPDVFIDDGRWKNMWLAPERCYIVLSQTALPRLEKLVGSDKLNVLAASGGKLILCNQAVRSSRL